MSVARRCMRDLHASAVAVYLTVPGDPMLAAAVVVVSPLGLIAPERLPLEDLTFASARAYQTGQICTARSYDTAARHLDFGVYAAAPHLVTAAPLAAGEQKFGVLLVFLPRVVQDLSPSETDYLRDAAKNLSFELDRLARSGVSLCPPRLPLVVSPESGAVAEIGQASAQVGDRSPDLWSAPFIFHLHKLSVSLTSVVHTRDAVALTIERLVSGFGAQAVAISLIEGDRLHVVGASGCSKEYLKSLNGISVSAKSPETEAITHKQQLIYKVGERGQSSGQGRVTADGRDEHVWVVLPLLAGDHALGTCSVGFTPEQHLIATQLSPLSTLSTLLGQTLERTQLYDASHALAQKLQQALLPRLLPQPAGVLTTSRYEPPTGAIELGGDWYDLITLPDGGVAAVIGDVEGHNTTAAVVMGQLSSAIRSYALEGHDPTAVLYRANRLLVDLETDHFATCCCVWLDPDTGTAQVVSAGHPRPLIRTADGAYLVAAADVGVPLGVEANPSYQASVHTLEPATLLVLYTDGLSGGELAQETLEAAVAASGDELEMLGDRLMGSGAGQAPRADDAALLLLRYEGPSAEVKEYIRRLHVLRHDFQGVRRTRHFLTTCLDGWHLDSLSDSAEVLASEVVTNALVHGDSDVDVCLRRYPDHLRVEVRDSDSHPAMLVDLGPDEDKAEGGRGLVIVSALASSWGNSPSGRGKTVWFEMDAQEAP
ncbi:ATP-binding SpoIIE family protein phosphatase [Streptomyces sp. NPDC001982]|uniref:ATP-binding SpoIIE family protein phosphatase n=1 Tax=Streptomyces sp. NPDC001982 TaxID=3154405 RepID=UPI0033283586